MHGWGGWTDVTRETADARERRRAAYEEALRTQKGSQRLRPNQQNSIVVIDLARLDIADWLAGTGQNGETNLDQVTPPVRSSDGAYRSAASSPVDQVVALAEGITTATWQEIAATLSQEPEAREIKRQLADHGWCDLFVGLIQVIEKFNETLDKIPEVAKGIVKSAIRGSTRQNKRTHVSDYVVNVVVDRVWDACRVAMLTKADLLTVTSDETLRALRILAVFSCPAPEAHKEVREHALKPLGNDVEKVLTDKTKVRLTELFTDWMK